MYYYTALLAFGNLNYYYSFSIHLEGIQTHREDQTHRDQTHRRQARQDQTQPDLDFVFICSVIVVGNPGFRVTG